MSYSIPTIFLRAQNAVDDFYCEQFSVVKDGIKYEPVFLPVLNHEFKEEGLDRFRKMLHRRRIGKALDSKYGGLIFTSQRAVAAFRLLVIEGVENGSGDYHDWPYLQDVPIYSVGPATTRALKAIPLDHPLNIRGSESGNGELLAEYILSDYHDWYRDWDFKCPLVFVAGERRHEAIPKALMNPELGLSSIPVMELDIYTTSIIPTFDQNLIHTLNARKENKIIWIVIFSPSVGEAMLRALGLLDHKTGREKRRPDHSSRKYFYASIGPTTRDSLIDKYDFAVDVCAAKPTAECLEQGIREYLINKY